MFGVSAYDVYKPFCVYAWKVWVFYYFTNKYSRFEYVDRKFDALDTFIEFKVESDKILSKHINAFWLHQGGVSSMFDSFHKEYEIIS